MKPRRQARQLALQVLYEVDVADHRPAIVMEQRLADLSNLPEEAIAFAHAMIKGVLEKSEELDDIISNVASDWPVDQMAIIDRNILRMALQEIQEGDTPIKVVINEAVELAKHFGSDSSRRFVNGALGAYVARHDEL